VNITRGHVKLFFQGFNTHGTEITPGSNIVGKDFDGDRLLLRIRVAHDVIARNGVDAFIQ
jgi:hypothetical protein